MRTATVYYHRFMNQAAVPVPNAASRRQVAHKVLDTVLTVVSCIGIIAIILFLLFLG